MLLTKKDEEIFNNTHIIKQKELVNKAYRAIGTPTTMKELEVTIAWSK